MANKETLENVKIVQKSYDDAPYKSKTFYYTQPGRQQMVLKLLGFKTPDLKNARVLEIGCSFGGNIIPFALENPKAEVIGIDLSSVQIEEGNRIIEAAEGRSRSVAQAHEHRVRESLQPYLPEQSRRLYQAEYRTPGQSAPPAGR